MSEATGLARKTVRAGRLEVEDKVDLGARAGAGRRSLDADQPGLEALLERLVEHHGQARLPRCAYAIHHSGCRREQQLPLAPVETRTSTKNEVG